MNGKIKFHKATSPAFNQGEIWVCSSGYKVEVVSVRKYPGATGDHMSDYGVTYKGKKSGLTYEKDCWFFPNKIYARSGFGSIICRSKLRN